MSHWRRVRLRSLLSWPGVLVPGLVVAAALVAGVWLGTRSTASAVPQFRLVSVTRETLSQALSTTGTIEPQTTAPLSFSAPGQVTAVDVTVGQHVTAGQTVATMDSPTLREQVAQATAALDSDQSQLARDTDGGASSAQIAADQAAVSADQSQVDSANDALSGAALVSPVDGIVTVVGYTVGQQVGGGGGGGGGSGDGGGGETASGGGAGSSDSGSSPSITVVSSSDVVKASVDASVVGEIKAGDQAMITTSGVNGPVTGTVASVGLTASTSSGVATFPVVVSVTGSTTGLYAGASASVSVVYRQVTDAVVVPAAAVLPGPGGDSVVRVMRGGRQVTRQVTTGITSGGLTQVTSGLSPGDRVVVDIVRLGGVSPGGGGPGNGGPVIFGPGVGKHQVFNVGAGG